MPNDGLMLLVLDRDVTSGLALVLPTDEVRDLFVLGLLNSRFVALVPRTQSILLDHVDA